VKTEEQILRRDANLVASGSFVPLSSIRATFMEWDTPFTFMLSLLDELESRESWQPGPLIDMLVLRSHTGVQKVARILARLSTAVQQVWMTQLAAFLLHSSLSSSESLANKDYTLREGSMPASVSPPSRDSIAYIARAIGTVKDAAWQNQLPRSLASEYMQMLEGVLPEDAHAFDHAIADIRSSVGEWLWLNVLTREDVDAAVEAL
jgi:gamma-tubulin complex component 4